MTEDKNEGFGYVSPEKLKKQAFFNFGIEIIAILLVIGLIFGVLIYLKVIDPGSMLNRITGKTQIEIQNKPIPKEVLNAKADIEVVSDVPGYYMLLKDKRGLVSLIRGWGIFGKSYYSATEGNTNKKPLEKIVIHFTDKPQYLLPYYDDADELIFTSGIKMSDSQFDLFVYINPKDYDDLKKVTEYLHMSIAGTLYQRSRSLTTAEQSVGEGFEFLDNFLLEHKNDKFIEIGKGSS